MFIIVEEGGLEYLVLILNSEVPTIIIIESNRCITPLHRIREILHQYRLRNEDFQDGDGDPYFIDWSDSDYDM